jgi:regulator of sigma E protease
MTGQRAQLGMSALLVFMAFLSINLAILNVLPIPALDGGHLVFLLIEKVKGSPLSINQRMIAQQIGLVFLLIVIVMVTYNDIVRFISG